MKPLWQLGAAIQLLGFAMSLPAEEIPVAECGVLTDAAVENSTLMEFSLAANEATPEMLNRHLVSMNANKQSLSSYII